MMGQLKLIGMRSAYDEVIEDGIRRQQPMPHVVGALLQAQIAAAHARSIAYQMGMCTGRSKSRPRGGVKPGHRGGHWPGS